MSDESGSVSKFFAGNISPSDDPDVQWDLTDTRELTEEEFFELSDALRTIQTSVDMEHHLLTIRNFMGYEQALHALTKVVVSRSQPSAPALTNLRQMVRTWFFNWLLSSRSYLDHTETRIKRRFGSESEEAKTLRKCQEKEYDGRFAYRFLYRLRHYAQHVDLPPVNVLVTESSPAPGEFNVKVTVNCRRGELLANWDGWGSAVKKEIEELDEEFPIGPYMKDLMESLEAIEECVEKLEAPFLDEMWTKLCDGLGEALDGEGTAAAWRTYEGETGRLKGMDWMDVPPEILEMLKARRTNTGSINA